MPAGIWRRKTIEAVGGWNSRTTVEDMDLSLRTYLAGWKAVFLKDVTCLNEVSLLCQTGSLPMSAIAGASTVCIGIPRTCPVT